MKKLAAVFIFVLLLPLSAQAGTKRLGVYAGAKAGASFNKLSAGRAGAGSYIASNYGLTLGYDFSVESGLPLRLELEGSVRGGDTAISYDSTLNDRIEIYFSSALMLQGWVDLPVSKTLKPYFGGGAGFVLAGYEARQDRAHEKYKDSFSRTWVLGGGLNWQVAELVWLDFGYRYLEANHFKTDFKGLPDYNFKIHSHDLQLGVRVVF